MAEKTKTSGEKSGRKIQVGNANRNSGNVFDDIVKEILEYCGKISARSLND